MRLVDARLVGAVKPIMARDELPPMVDLDRLPVGLHFDLPPRQAERHRVAVGLEGDETVLGDVPDGPAGRGEEPFPRGTSPPASCVSCRGPSDRPP